MNPHPVVPPISTDPDVPLSAASPNLYPNNLSMSQRGPNDLTDMLRHLPPDSFLPGTPVSYPTREELELRRRVHSDLKEYNPKRFRDIYTELTGYDPQLSGYINLKDLAFTLSKNQMNVNALNMRLVAAMFVSPQEPGKVNYEQMLSFLAASQRDASGMQVIEPATHPNNEIQEQRKMAKLGVQYNFITHRLEDIRHVNSHTKAEVLDPYGLGPRSQKYLHGDRDTAKLLRYLEEQLGDSAADLDIEKCWNAFSTADRDKRGSLSPDQIKKMVYSLGIPLQDSLIIAIMDKCGYNNGQVKWEQFLEFINRVVPRKTGLTIPESKKPREYAKHYSIPDTNWPRGEWDKTEVGIPVPRQRPLQQQDRRPPSPTRQSYDNPNDLLPQYNQRQQQLEDLEARTQRQADTDRVHYDVNRAGDDYHPASRGPSPPKPESSDERPWLKRFMEFADKVYAHDASHTGKVKLDEFRHMASEYNYRLALNLPEAAVDGIVEQHTKKGMVDIHLALRKIGMMGS